MQDTIFFQNANLRQLLVVYANAKPKMGGFVVVSDYRESIHATITLNQAVYSQNNQLISSYFGIPFTLNGRKHEFFIHSNLSSFDFFEHLFNQIETLRANISTDDFIDTLLTCFFGLRGSIDITGSFYTIDLLDIVVNHNPDYIIRLQNWTSSIPTNLNIRDQQPQYVNGEVQRNTQYRVPLRFVFDRIEPEIRQINIYKHNILITKQNLF